MISGWRDLGEENTHTHTFREGRLWRTNFVIHFFGIYLGGNSDTLASMRMYLDDFFGVFVVVVFLWLLGRFGCPSGWVTYLGQLWMTLDNNNNNIHSVVVVVWGCSIGSRYVNVRRDLPRLLLLYLTFLPNVRIPVVGFLEISFSLSVGKLRSISGAFSSSLDLTDDDDHYFTQYLAERLDEMSVSQVEPDLDFSRKVHQRPRNSSLLLAASHL